MIDMSSTQALLHMVRTANAAQNAAELETYLKGKWRKAKLHFPPFLFLSRSLSIFFSVNLVKSNRCIVIFTEEKSTCSRLKLLQIGRKF